MQDKVIHSATQCAFATSQLVACARVVAPTIESPACQEQLTAAAKQVARAVEDLLVDAQAACKRSITDGQRSYGDIHEAARQVTTALDELLLHVKTSPRIIRTTQENYEYEQILNQSRKIITYQGPTEDMVRQGESAIRHSRLLVEQMEAEADRAPERRDRLLDAARSVAQATSRMIDATKVNAMFFRKTYKAISIYFDQAAVNDFTSLTKFWSEFIICAHRFKQTESFGAQTVLLLSFFSSSIRLVTFYPHNSAWA
ncbi:unnamed protein product [Gongylonema pulchrum]|uniref:Talin IBS2B domain-containing protein n=1 Tax=Gongylonema pulchrum TaxID=637853 RepID=A0A3P7NTA4_9BILA|nr:unnamed protein product [Gongylonema pulchrum]